MSRQDRLSVLRSQIARLERINALQSGENQRRSAATIARLRAELEQEQEG